jgi:hypothetical protein
MIRHSLPLLFVQEECAPLGRQRQPVAPLEFDWQRLRRSHLPGRSDRQLQYLAKCAQILIPWSHVIIFPKIDTRGADADLFGNFDNR